MSNDRRSSQIALISLVVAVIAIIVDATTPEIREFFGIKKSNTNAQNPPVVTSTSTEIKSDVGSEAQLKELEQLLKQGDFKAADKKTRKIMLYVAHRETEGWIDRDSMQKFSCTDLRTIDQLWVNNSNGRFGFSVQKRIFEANGKDWDKFYNAIGWIEGGKGKSYSELTFQKNAEKGHLPFSKWLGYDWENGGEKKIGIDFGGLLWRVDVCKM